MLTHYVTVAFRALRKRPGYTLINVGGLGLGLACCFLIVLFIQHERSFDGFHEHGDRIHRLTVDQASRDQRVAITAAGLAPAIEANLGGAERVIRYANQGAPYLRLPDGEMRKVSSFFLADAGFFDTFSFRFLRGDPATALDDPRSVVLTATQARALFGDADPLGQTLQREDIPLTVTGVIEDLPANTHFRFNALGAFGLLRETAGPDALDDLTNWNYRTYVLLEDGTAPDAFADEVTPLLRELTGDTEGDLSASLQPLAGLRFNTEILDYDLATRDPRLLWVFAVIGALILLIACVNFTNLATARATQRAREVGVRKSLGAHPGQLIRQHLGESVLLSSFAIVVGIAGAALALPVFNDALGGTTALNLRHPATLAGLVAIGLGAGLIAGTYPAFYLTRFAPARVLKGDLSHGGGSPLLRKGLIVFQFTISAFLIVATLTVTDQLRFMQSQDLGFAQEQVVTFSPPRDVMQQYDAFKQSLLAGADVIGVALANGLPGSVGMTRGYHWPGAETGTNVSDDFTTILGDADYLKTVGLELAEGRWFRDGAADVENTYLLNETAVRTMGLDDPVGHAFRAWDGDESGTIIGVVKDFHYATLRLPIEPVVLHYKPDWMGTIAVRFAAGEVAGGLEHLHETFERAAPGYTLDYRFLDEGFERQYRDEARLSTLLTFFASVAVFIACLGIFGLAALAAERRRKEIGVRKVLGASVANLTALLAGDFVKLVGIAFILAAPLAWFAMRAWLEGFAYATVLGPGVFLVAGVAVLAVALLTVSTQAVRAASADPVESLRYE